MEVKIVDYKDRKYSVWSPGVILRDERGYLMDQLSNDHTKCMGRSRIKYLKDTYNISEEDYYIIVVLLGDNSKLPVCPYKGCNNKLKFISLNGTDRLFSRGCCEKHSRSLAEQYNNRVRLDNGTHHLLGCNRSTHFTKGSEYYSNSASIRALKQVKNGNHPWAGQNGTDLFNKRVREGNIFIFNTEFSSKLQKDRINNGTHQFLNVDSNIKADRTIFLNKGNIDDICYFYISTIVGDTDNFKIGVTVDPEYRKKFHHMKEYSSLEILKTGNREYIAELEYKVKMKYKEFTSIGTETFPNSMRDEILNFINTL